MRCAVKNCMNDNDSKASTISFFAFPSNADFQKEWIKFCCRKENYNPKTAVICMDHFRPEDLSNKLQYDMGLAKKRLFNRCAVPTIKKRSAKSEKIFIEREERIQKRENKKTVQMLINEYEAASALIEATFNPSSDVLEQIEVPADVSEQNLPSCSKTNDEIQQLKSELEFLHGENKQLKNTKRKFESQLKAVSEKMEKESQINELNMHALKLQLTKANYEVRNLEDILLNLFTKGQIKKLKGGIKRRMSTEEDIIYNLQSRKRKITKTTTT